jgi:hypothetical protein
MAINQDVQDIDNYPGTVKRITLDVDSIVPTGTEGDEKMMLVGSTSAYSDNVDRTAIQDIYLFKGYVGWSKSSGLRGVAGKFALASGANTVSVSMDATVSGTRVVSDRGYYDVVLDYNIDTTSRTGEDVASDMQAKIRAIDCVTADEGFQLAYNNCSVKFENGKFIIASGSIANSYTGSDRTSVSVVSALTNDCIELLGYDHAVTSEVISGVTVTESLITSDYTAGTATVSIGSGTGVSTGDALYITDGVNSNYFTALNVVSNDITVAYIGGGDTFDAISNSYTTASGSYVQILRTQDPEVIPSSYFADVDSTLRFMAKSLINQIDFSS